METIKTKFEDGYEEIETSLSKKEDSSLIKVLIELEKANSNWRIQKQYNIRKLGTNFILDTSIDGKQKYLNFFIEDIENK